MIAITPKTDCPHVAEHAVSAIAADINVSKACNECKANVENWVCCKCGEVGCSRYQNSHMSTHAETTQHRIAASFSDISVWCYACESYIAHASLAPILAALRASKFPQQAPLGPSSSTTTAPSTVPTNSSKENEKKDEKAEKDVTSSLANLSIEPEPQKKPAGPILPSLDIEGVAEFIKSGKAKNIIVMTGAGVSVAAGIPDFRTPGTGLYYNLQKYNLPNPTAVFEIDYFEDHPQAFYTLAKELYPGTFVPTYVHYFIKLMHEKGLLLRNYTQNIDTLERIAKVPPEALVEAHGTFGTSHCIRCKKEYHSDYVKDAVFSDRIPRCEGCNGLVKPDIVFFGEGLPSRFFSLLQEDFPKCDLLIVIGTSLQVHPFAGLVKRVTTSTPRLLINREEVGTSSFMDLLATTSGGFTFNHPNNVRDVKLLGECQEGVKKLADLLGWGQELEDLYQRESKIILANKPSSSSSTTTSTTTTTITPTGTTVTTETTTVTTEASKVPFLDTGAKEAPVPKDATPAPTTTQEATTPAPTTPQATAPATAPTSAPTESSAAPTAETAPPPSSPTPVAASPEKPL